MHRSPQWLDRRSLELHRLIAQRVRSDPRLLDQAKATLTRWQRLDARGCPGWDEWAGALAAGLQSTLEAMLDEGERGQYLRSCTPFTRVLTPRERNDFLRSWNANS
jgi:hypothetical protein